MDFFLDINTAQGAQDVCQAQGVSFQFNTGYLGNSAGEREKKTQAGF